MVRIVDFMLHIFCHIHTKAMLHIQSYSFLYFSILLATLIFIEGSDYSREWQLELGDALKVNADCV
jgi:hypothetical protein